MAAICTSITGDPEIGQRHENGKFRAVIGWNHINDTLEGIKQGKVWSWVSTGDALQVYDQDFDRSEVRGEVRFCGVANFTMLVRMFHPYFLVNGEAPMDGISYDKRECRRLYHELIAKHKTAIGLPLDETRADYEQRIADEKIALIEQKRIETEKRTAEKKQEKLDDAKKRAEEQAEKKAEKQARKQAREEAKRQSGKKAAKRQRKTPNKTKRPAKIRVASTQESDDQEDAVTGAVDRGMPDAVIKPYHPVVPDLNSIDPDLVDYSQARRFLRNADAMNYDMVNNGQADANQSESTSNDADTMSDTDGNPSGGLAQGERSDGGRQVQHQNLMFIPETVENGNDSDGSDQHEDNKDLIQAMIFSTRRREHDQLSGTGALNDPFELD